MIKMNDEKNNEYYKNIYINKDNKTIDNEDEISINIYNQYQSVNDNELSDDISNDIVINTLYIDKDSEVDNERKKANKVNINSNEILR